MAFRIISGKRQIFALANLSRSNQNQMNGSLNRRNVCTSMSLWKRVAFNLSDIGEGIREVVVKEWFVKEGDVVEQFDNLCEVQSDKASVTITSRYDGKILKLYHDIDEIALVGKPLIDFDVTDDANTNEDVDKTERIIAKEKVQNKKIDIKSVNPEKIPTTPAVRRIANENNVNLAEIKASGPNGRILKSDIMEFLGIIPPTNDSNRSKPLVEKPKNVQSPIATEPMHSTIGNRVEKLKDVRKVMFKSMTSALKIPHFTYSDEVNVTDLIELRNSLKAEAESIGVKLTFMPFFIKAASLALAKFPILNSSIDEENESIIYKSAHNISIAMATQSGLVVPNVKNCEQKTILQIARDFNNLLERGRSGKLTPPDFQNGTFSLSNIGVVGGTYTKPVITPPQVAIGAIGTTHIVPRFVGDSDKIQRAHLIYVSWSADHRIVDGVSMAGFSNEWKRYLENPNRFVLQ
ncbi:lipoamide acyltransferase component of branched-chain alpha-keto acid dehydrogenase complex, mitochondrial isoform X1 [Contarinia nasturtii]|uniref:lipoamide acyltransferase component of branched-chain alpha-keto acid dehydrogenase complex, mitochondrial isoform X1 n=2 Tax=Contarinia nasturtii TaxID=265458 RepID=UPI0012D471D2|nr:lipoamide acyltransferase component of branched-chain alpha-keto acid dehydrogenase complex, mitochondrial isoform X1 [Contarinia nasturtii]